MQDVDMFITRLTESLKNIIYNFDFASEDNQLKITGDCIYCGRSKRGLPHMGIVIHPHHDELNDSNIKVTGGMNCFRCGVSKTLKGFLYDLREELKKTNITWTEIKNNVVIVESKSKSISYDFNFTNNRLSIEKAKFIEVIRNKYGNDSLYLKQVIFMNMNAFEFIRSRLNLNREVTIYDAYDLLREVKAKCVFDNNRFVLSFAGVVNYVFRLDKVNKDSSRIIRYTSELDSSLYGSNELKYIFQNYIKMKNTVLANGGYYIIKDSNLVDATEEAEILNVYVSEGVFDTLTMRFHKSMFNLSDINNVRYNIYNMYVAVCHYKIQTFIIKMLNSLINKTMILPKPVKRLNFILIPDLNMNPRKYVSAITNALVKDSSDMITLLHSNLPGIDVRCYYLNLFSFGNDVDENGEFFVKDVNDMLHKLNKKVMKNISLVEVF